MNNELFDKLGMMKKPLEIGTASVVLCFAVRKLLGVRAGVNSETFYGAAKVFMTITGVATAVEWMNSKNSL